jgi:REP element-mobilizing transposase RayT
VTRPLRLELPGAIHHVTARGNAREPVYHDETDRVQWSETLGNTASRFGWLVLGYCQMGNHYHLLVETPQPNLSRGMRQLNGVYAQRFNRRHDRVGHVFQARFHATLIERSEHLLAVSAYLPLNPVRAGLCTEPAQWRWSSYRATIGLEPPRYLAIDRLLAYFGEGRDAARERYRAHVEAIVDESVAAELEHSVILGSDDFARAVTGEVAPRREIARRHWQPVRPSLGELLARPSNEAIARAYSRYGYTMGEIADHVGVHYATVSRRLRRHEAALSECKT